MYEHSNCCNAPVRTEPQDDLDDPEGKTFFHVCTFCNKLTDVKPLSNRIVSKIGNKNPQWKGSGVGYAALHDWVKRRLKKPLNCQKCQKEKVLDLANISGKYKRALSDWEWLCRKCHMIKDGRLKKLIKRNIDKRLSDKICLVCDKKFHSNKRTSAYCSKSCATTWFNLNKRIYKSKR